MKEILRHVMEPSKTLVLMAFVATCIEATARVMGVSYLEVLHRMQRVKLIEQFIVPRYETLHSESRENLVLTTSQCLKEWEEKQ